jgi:signal transduction histidine kinase
MQAIVADTTPLNYLVLIQAADILPELYRTVLIPPAVKAELAHANTPAVVHAWISQPPPWLEVVSLKLPVDSALAYLDAGERERAIKEAEFSARILRLQDEERRRIARELHDGVGQLLAAMSMNASRLEKEKAKLSPNTARCAEENSRLIEQASADIRTISYLFHPPLLDEMGLHSALKWYIEGFTKRSKIAAKLELPADEDGERLPPDYELCLFRIAQESLTNIHRHSGSSTAVVRLLRSRGEIKMEVSDEGKGLDQGTQTKIASGETAGVGLRGMQERVRPLGGSVEIQSNGKGTRVTARLPLAESGRSANSSSDDGHESHSPLPERSADVATTIMPELASGQKAAKA